MNNRQGPKDIVLVKLDKVLASVTLRQISFPWFRLN